MKKEKNSVCFKAENYYQVSKIERRTIIGISKDQPQYKIKDKNNVVYEK